MSEKTVVLSHTPFDWCRDRKQCAQCPGTVTRFYLDNNLKRKKDKSPVVYTDEIRRCPCKCHGKVNKDEVVKKRRARRKK